MKEKIVRFGKDACCSGIMTEPDMKAQNAELPAVLLWNAGLLHRVGPYRLYVDLARKFASIGFLVLRFDLSGKGDSEARGDNASERERSIFDIRDAMDILSQRKGISRFVLLGLCSGADDAFPVGVQDSRVVGLVLLDGYGYRTLGYYFHHYGPRLFRLAPWQHFFKRSLHAIFAAMNSGGVREKSGGDIFVREFPPKIQVEKELLSLVERQVNVLFIYSGGVKYHYYNYRGQFKDMFKGTDFGDKIQVEYFEEAAHTYTRLDHRNKLMNCILDWMQEHYGQHERTASGNSKIFGADTARCG